MTGFITAIYIIAGILFILSLKGLSNQESAKRGNIYGILGMTLAIGATLYGVDFSSFEYMNYLVFAMIGGSFIGLMLALRVKMTAMPELIALLHSFVGMAAVLIGFVNYLEPIVYASSVQSNIHHIEIVIGIFIGAVTFTGSLVAFGKLKEILSSSPLVLPLKHFLNIAMLIGAVYLSSLFLGTHNIEDGQMLLVYITIIAFVFGIHLVMSIGGADMPVVISMLNSYSGWAAAATGFMLSNDLLIITGALVGSSGAILSYIMCKAMNRSFISVILGGFGVKAVKKGEVETREALVTNASEVANLLLESKKVMVVPGYGMAIAHAQYALKDLNEILKDNNIELTFAIHPVAGRMPGHMNVLLAEAKLPYDIVFEMDEVNDELDGIDTILVIGANDTVNPSALDDEDSPIAGMPVIKVWEAKNVIVFKRGMSTGYAGVQNPLFFKENSRMLFGDAKKSLEDILSSLRS
jgi:NAD(P) transhydrogenase subunit beta